MEKWKNIEPGMWKPEKEGDNIIGILVNKEPKDEDAGISARYYLENQEGMFFVWGCAVLDDRMQYVKPGEKVRITYEGKTTNKRNQKVNLYRVDVAEGKQAEDSTGVAKKEMDSRLVGVDQTENVM
jgi:hypothetical protein